MNGLRWVGLRLAVWVSELIPCAATTRLRQSLVGRCMHAQWERRDF